MLNKNIPIYILILLGLALWGTEYVRRDLWEPDEARFALVAKEMRDGGHWLVPYRQGEFYSHKPPLMFWLTNAFSVLTGGHIGNVAPRLPSFLGAMLALFAVSRIAGMWFSTRTGWMTVLLLSSSFLFWNKGGFGQIDMLLCGLGMMALYFLFSANQHHDRWRIVAGYSMMGLAVLAKGPVGLAVPLGVYALVSYSADEKARIKGHWIWGPLISLAFPGFWLLLAWWHGAPEGYFSELLFSQNVGRLAGEFGGHHRPFYYFLYYFPMDFLPWSLLLPLSFRAMSRDPEGQRGRKKLLVWILFVIVFFSLSASKRNLYILLAYPAAAMMVAAGVDYWSHVTIQWLRYSFWLVWGLLVVLGVGMISGSFLHHLPLNALTLLPGGLVLVSGAWWSYESWRKFPRLPNWLGAMATSMLIVYACVGAWVLPEFDTHKTPHVLIEEAHAMLGRQDRIIMYKQQGEIFSLYTERMGFMADSPKELANFLLTAPQTHHMIVMLQRDVPDVERIIGDQHEMKYFSMGNKKLAWVKVDDVSSLFLRLPDVDDSSSEPAE